MNPELRRCPLTSRRAPDLDAPLVRPEGLAHGHNVSVGVVYSLDDGRVLQPLVVPVLTSFTHIE